MKKPALVYTGLSLIGAILFYFAASDTDYTTVERVGGMVWVFVLLMIILMPAVSNWTRRKTPRSY